VPDRPVAVGLARWGGRVTRPGDRERDVVVEWPPEGVPRVLVDGRKVNAKQRRRWLDLLAQKGVTRERVAAAIERGEQRVSLPGGMEFGAPLADDRGVIRGEA
jgi:hypothetical protein